MSERTIRIIDVTTLRPRPAVPNPLRIVALGMTTGGYPTQWEGWDQDGYFVYIRYRGGRLVVSWGHDEDDALGHDPVWEVDGLAIGGGGTMLSPELIPLLPRWIEIAPDAFDHDVTLDHFPGELTEIKERLTARQRASDMEAASDG